MRVLILDMKDDEGRGLDLAMRAQDAGHQVNYWLHRGSHPAGRGLVPRVTEWQVKAEAADLIVLTGNCDYPDGLEEMFAQNYPIFGANRKAAELELDREVGQKVLEKVGIDTIPYQVVKSPEEGIELILDTHMPYVMKPWGGESDKAMTCVPNSVDDAIFTLWKWKKDGVFKGELMMQERVSGIEMGISGFFGPGGWSRAIEESFEHKKFLTDDLGENTGEMGTVIRHVTKSKLFDQLLDPLTDHLHAVRYVGDCSVNCIIADGRPWPLEFTMRLGWPDFCIRQEVIEGDPVQWMYDLIHGRDTLEVRPDVALGVVMTHGDFPKCRDSAETWSGYPIRAPEPAMEKLRFQDAMLGKYPIGVYGKGMKEIHGICTGGQYVAIATGSGPTVVDAQRMAYNVADCTRWPSNVMYRTDIGERLMQELEILQRWGYANGLKYS